MKALINKISIKISNYKASKKSRLKPRSFLRDDYYMCRGCKRVLPKEEMNPNDRSVCDDCSKS